MAIWKVTLETYVETVKILLETEIDTDVDLDDEEQLCGECLLTEVLIDGVAAIDNLIAEFYENGIEGDDDDDDDDDDLDCEGCPFCEPMVGIAAEPLQNGPFVVLNFVGAPTVLDNATPAKE